MSSICRDQVFESIEDKLSRGAPASCRGALRRKVERFAADIRKYSGLGIELSRRKMTMRCYLPVLQRFFGAIHAKRPATYRYAFATLHRPTCKPRLMWERPFTNTDARPSQGR